MEELTDKEMMSDEEVMQLTKHFEVEEVFVYGPNTDRTQFVMHVLGRCIDKNIHDDTIDRALLIFHPKFTLAYSKEVATEIHELIGNINGTTDTIHLRIYDEPSLEIVKAFSHYII